MLKNLACLQPTLNNLFYPPNKGDYVYFESTPQFQYPNSSWAADAAMLAYARYQAARMDEAELNRILDPHFTTRGTNRRSDPGDPWPTIHPYVTAIGFH